MAASKRPRYDPSVAEATAKVKVSQAKQMESLTTEIVPAIVTAAKQLLGKGSKVSTETFWLAPKVAQNTFYFELGFSILLFPCIITLYLLSLEFFYKYHLEVIHTFIIMVSLVMNILVSSSTCYLKSIIFII